MKKPKIYFVTTNDFKYKCFIEEVGDGPCEFIQLSMATPEIQAENNRKVAEFSARWAANTRGAPVITEDVGLYIKSLNGFPGPNLSQAERQLGAEGILSLLDNKGRDAYWEYAIAYCEPNSDPVSFYAIQKGQIANLQTGDIGWPVGKIFIPEGESETISTLLSKENYKRNNSHYHQMKKFLKSRYGQGPTI